MEHPVPILHTPTGIILLNKSLTPVAFNNAALQILSFPTDPGTIHQPMLFIRDKVRFWLLKAHNGLDVTFVHEFASGKRTYNCRAFHCDCQHCGNDSLEFVVLFERQSHGASGLAVLTEQFRLTPRELQTVALLLEGLTSKQIAARLKISPNTVKAFLRIVMFKMDVSTRSGIVGKVLSSVQEPRAGDT